MILTTSKPQSLALFRTIEDWQHNHDDNDQQTYCIHEHNTKATNYIKTWPNWLIKGLVLVGPKGCGKSTLANMWCHRAQAQKLVDVEGIYNACDLHAHSLGAHVLIDDVDTLHMTDDVWLMIYNALHNGHWAGLVMTTQRHPDLWSVATADARSRIQTFEVLSMNHGSEEFYAQYALWCFGRIGFDVTIEFCHHMLQYCPRSYEGVMKATNRLCEVMTLKGRGLSKKSLEALLKDSDALQ